MWFFQCFKETSSTEEKPAETLTSAVANEGEEQVVAEENNVNNETSMETWQRHGNVNIWKIKYYWWFIGLVWFIVSQVTSLFPNIYEVFLKFLTRNKCSTIKHRIYRKYYCHFALP